MTTAALKEKIRNSLPPADLSPGQLGKLAQQVRKIAAYQNCSRVFMAPAPTLWQARINALLDQKELLMPSAGLKQGFILFKPNSVPFAKLAHAVTFKGMAKYGECLASSDLSGLDIGFSLIGSEAVDGNGFRLGDGLGFTDLAMAILHAWRAIKPAAPVFSIVAANRVLPAQLPADPWDIRLDGYITPARIEYVQPPREPMALPICWADLPKKRIRKIQPLWDLYCRDNPAPTSI